MPLTVSSAFCAGREADGDAGRRLAVVLGVADVALGIQRDARHVADAHLRTVGIDAQQDVAELLRAWTGASGR